MKKTVKLKKTLDTRGGERTKTKNPSPYSLLIEAIWTKFGGPKAVANLLNENFQAPVNWRLRGKVPLEKVQIIGNTLKIPVWGLNYEGCKAILGAGGNPIPSWESVVKSYGLPTKTESYILKQSKKYNI